MTPATRAGLPLDPLAATIHLRIGELQADADARRLRREASSATRPGLAWPGSVVAALRETVARATATRGGQACATC